MGNPYTHADIVMDDLRYLATEWPQGLSDHQLRRDAAILRRLLLDKELCQLWRDSGRDGEPNISGTFFVKGIPADAVNFAMASTISLPGGTIHAMLELNRHVEGVLWTEETTYPISAYMNQTCAIIDGARIRRRHVILLVANKLGGAHYDENRGRKIDKTLAYLDRVLGVYHVMDRHAVYALLLGIGQEVIASPDVRGLIAP